MAFLAFLLSLAQPASCQPAPMPISAPLTTQRSYHMDFIIILASATIPKQWSLYPLFSLWHAHGQAGTKVSIQSVHPSLTPSQVSVADFLAVRTPLEGPDRCAA